MGQVWLYRLNLPPREKNIFPSSSYKDTWPMPRYRYGSTCKDNPTICKIWLKSKFLVYGDYFDTLMERVSHLFRSGRYASEVGLFVEFEY